MSDNASLKQQSATAADARLLNEIAALLVESLSLEVTAAQISPQAALYAEGLGLDSIDILELALVVSKRYGVHLRADNAENMQIFASLQNLSDYIATHRTK